MISIFNVGLKTLLRDVLSEQDFFYKFKKPIGRNDFSLQFIKIISRYRCIGYATVIAVMRQPACLVFNPIMVGIYIKARTTKAERPFFEDLIGSFQRKFSVINYRKESVSR